MSYSSNNCLNARSRSPTHAASAPPGTLLGWSTELIEQSKQACLMQRKCESVHQLGRRVERNDGGMPCKGKKGEQERAQAETGIPGKGRNRINRMLLCLFVFTFEFNPGMVLSRESDNKANPPSFAPKAHVVLKHCRSLSAPRVIWTCLG